MNSSALQLTLREWQRQMAHPTVWTVLAGITAILALIGPFETEEAFNLPTALAYWATISVLGYGIGLFVSLYVEMRFGAAQNWGGVILGGAVAGGLIAIPVTLINMVAFGNSLSLTDHLIVVATVVVVTIIITALIAMLHRALRQDPVKAPALPPLLDRLPLDKRGALLAISVEDHYVRIATTKGEELVLMRLSDAIREVGDTRGAQVHRSHWVSFKAVASVARNGAGAVLTLTDGREVPVSRANMPKIKEAGLLPR